MKKIRIFATALLLAFTLSSCESFFDVELDDQAKIEDIFRQKTEVQKYLSHLYSNIPHEEDVLGMHASTVAPADESLFSWYQWVYYTQFRTGNYSSATTNFNYWPDYYIGINQCSIFLKYIDLDKEDTPATLAYMKAEARFLRAYYYFLLFRQYGPVFIWGDQIADEFDAQFPGTFTLSRLGQPGIDIAAAALQELAKAGVPADNVVSSRARVNAATQYLSEDEELAEICQADGEGEPQLAERFKKIRRSLCTLENPLWFSHRRATIAGKAHEGRMLALIVRE